MGWFSSSLNGVWSSAEPAGAATRVTPDAPWVSAAEMEHTFRLHMSWDLVLNFAAKDLNYKFPIKEVPLRGNWSIDIVREGGEVKIRLMYGGGLSVGFLGTRIVQAISLCWVGNDGQQCYIVHNQTSPDILPGEVAGDIGRILTINTDAWIEATRVSGGAFVPATQRSYRLTFTLEQATEKDSSTRSRHLTTSACAFLATKAVPSLWTTSDLLFRSSPYFVDLFSSPFAESEMRTGVEDSQKDDAAQSVTEKNFEDSDDETDEVLFSKRPHLIKRSPKANDIPFRQITITQTAFSTYHAVLVFLQTDFIDFLPLSSSLSPSGLTSRSTVLDKALDKDPSLPSPVSPKSVYRLAHLLQLDDLQTISLNAFRSSLSSYTAAQELFSDTSLAYDDLRAVVVEFCRVNWAEVKKSEGWKERTKKAKGKEGTAEEKAAVFEVYEAVA